MANSKLKDRVEAKHSGGCDFMDQRDKGDFADLEGMDVTLEDAYLIKDDEGNEFYAFIVKEYPENFFFSNGSLFEIIEEAAALAAEEGTSLKQQIEDEVIRVGEKEKSKKGRWYRKVTIL